MKPSNYFPSIDILRGFAAISVVVYHVIEIFEWKSYPIEGLAVWFRIGWMGVDLFFVISGFVIALSAFSEIDKHGPTAFRNPFMRRRLARIVPLHYLTCLVFVALVVPQLLFGGIFWNALTHLLFIHNLFPGFHGAINGANWSLGVEMQFYLLMLVLAPWIQRANLWRLAGVFVLSAWAWRLGCTILYPVVGDQGAGELFQISSQLPGALDEFVAGILLARFVCTERGSVLLKKAKLWGLPLAAAGVWVTQFIFWRYTYWDIPAMVVFFKSLLALACVLTVFAACTLNARWWLVLTKPLRYLGVISYGIYLWHLPVLLTLKELKWLTPQQALPYALALTICLAMVSWHWVEKPFIRRYANKPVTP
ncbi:MAG: acyltransferase [Rhodoferax sp.]|nr:acyltransferase [Rhodoferax sp.]